MNKIKVIDLLNMISRGVDVPGQIKYGNTLYSFDTYDKDYKTFDEDERLFQKYFSSDIINIFLNDEIEIIEENKKLKHLENYSCFETLTNEGKLDYLYEMITRVIDKVNELENK